MSRLMTVVVAMGVMMLAGSALGQAQGGGGQNGGRGGRGNFDPAQMRQRMMDSYKERLGASDDEMKVIGPKLEKVMTAQREIGGGGMFGGRGGRGGPGGDQAPTTAVGKAQQELQQALDNKDTPAPTIAKKLEALRTARVAAEAELTKAQAELKEVLTQRQEAVLVMRGTLK